MFYYRKFAQSPWLMKRNVRRKSSVTGDGISRVFLFPGQGSQFVGMCERFHKEPWLLSLFDKVSSCVGFDLLKMCLNGPDEELQKTENCQLAVVTASLAAVQWCRYHGYLEQPGNKLSDSNVCATAGFSVGEFAALVFAEAFSLDDAIKVIHCRAKAMQEASEKTPSGMVTVKGLNENEIQELCTIASNAVQSKDSVVIANHLYTRGHVIAGPMDAVEYVLQFGKSKHGARDVFQLPVSGAFHTALMSSAQPIVKEALDAISVCLPEIPVYSNVTGKPYESVEMIKTLLVDQIVQPVQWQSLIQNVIKDWNPDMFYEVGPGRQLTAMLYQIDTKYRRRCKNIQV
ncbi:malonyl-CoA-acyl carrier protein transacylase, mitochondrial [Exaiptasia diaphana]|uniref:Malonyl-CoA:ACP transacylase (MAT) domain-containing protein n=1 Tax=Exaiptasia diaphana TaxID=2652724 RepID=A0A913X285_EXADI|nr:malonyl-CoA-acyl carrier protein transacylase, mitochondrial [Exaiptasia diaphana]KXJ27307.1 Malonyl-CoA-acyl carrier protein transacylase, mitochondrial [Exaiptasia diaphana]